MSRKITIIGAGQVGSTVAYALTLKQIASEIVIIDIIKEKAMGEAGGKGGDVPFVGEDALGIQSVAMQHF